MSLTPDNIRLIERRVLSYLDQCGGSAHRTKVASALASPESRIGSGIHNGSNAGIPLIMGAWCSRLIKAGYVVQVDDREGYYRRHAITDAGRRFVRNL